MHEARREVKKLSDCLMRDHSWDVESDLRIRVFEQINNLMQTYSLTLLYGEKCISDDKLKKGTLSFLVKFHECQNQAELYFPEYRITSRSEQIGEKE